MTESLRTNDRPFDRDSTPAQPDFDLVEDYGAADANDQDAFDQALNALLPHESKGAAEGAAGVDIDLDDFEAFNRELDARLAEARAHPADDAVEDLGTEIIPAAPLVAAPAADEPAAVPGTEDLPEDVVTLGAASVVAATPAAAPRAPAPPPAPSPAPAPLPASAVAKATTPAARRTGSGWAMTLGFAGLVAGAAGLWLNRTNQDELANLQGALTKVAVTAPAAAAPPPVPSFAPELERLDARVTELTRTVEALTAAAKEGSASATRALAGLEERLTRAEAQFAAAKTTETAAKESSTEQTKAVAEPAVKTPATESPRAVAAAVPAKPAAPPVAVAPETPKPTAEKPKPVPEAGSPAAAPPVAAAAKVKKPLPQAAGGAWGVVVESFASEADAYKRLNRVENMGLVADVVPTQINGQTWHRLVVPGYASQEDAKAIAADLKGRGLGQPWVYQRKSE